MVFKMPTFMKITGRTSSVTNAFVNSIIPVVYPSAEEVKTALEILDIDPADLRCAYCGDRSTEWDHLRPLVKDKKPTGNISEIRNLVPACGKCNQSKGNKEWRSWMFSPAPLSPNSRGVKNIEEKVNRLEKYEKWGNVRPLDLEKLVGRELWIEHWQNLEQLHELMEKSQATADKLNEMVKNKILKKF